MYKVPPHKVVSRFVNCTHGLKGTVHPLMKFQSLCTNMFQSQNPRQMGCTLKLAAAVKILA